MTTPTAWFHLPAGTAAAGTAPLKLTTATGTLLVTAEAGAIEFLTTKLYFTPTTGFGRWGVSIDSKQIAAPTTGATVTATNDVLNLIVNPAGTLATLTINFPAPSADGQEFDICFSQIVTALTLTAVSPATTIIGGISAGAVGGYAGFVYDSASLTWYRNK